uniref:Uncharacterized protein n=1 Tax=Avena sativa TaxID=4498 RepID=A0ACD6AFF9_AVESA
MDEGATLVSRYMGRRRSQDGISEMRMGEDCEDHEQEITFEEDEDDEDDDYELEEDFDDEDIGEGSNGVAQGRKFRSKSWREFEPIHVDGEVTNGECKHCGAVISAKRGNGTSGLRNHLKRCKARATVVGALDQMNATLMTPDGVSRLWKWDPDVARKMLVRMVVLHEFPLSIVEYDGFRKFVSSLNPSFHMITRKALKNDILKAFDEQKKSLKELFGASKSRVSLTMDLWTSNQTIGYMVITAHFINDCWKLEKRIIKFNALETPHTGVSMFNMVLKCIRELNLEDKIFAITLDNASNNGRMVQMLREYLVSKNMLLGEGILLHQKCAAHILNLVCQAGIEYLDPILTNIRKSVKFIRVTATRKEKFAEIVTQKGITCERSPCLDVPTRWNSTFTMITVALRYRRAFDALERQDPQYSYAPSASEWEEAKAVCKLLGVFFEATKVISGSKYPTANLYFQQMWQAKEALDNEASREDSPFPAMIVPMQKKLEKYWKLSWLALSIPVILDPRFKFTYLKFRYPRVFGNSAATKLTRVKEIFKKLFEEYAKSNLAENAQTQQGVDDMDMESNDPLSDWDHHLSTEMSSTSVGSSELDAYWLKPPIARTDNFDILDWWKANSGEYPILASMARDALAIPASTVASESAFSTKRSYI